MNYSIDLFPSDLLNVTDGTLMEINVRRTDCPSVAEQKK
jgi:hypothetical protein